MHVRELVPLHWSPDAFWLACVATGLRVQGLSPSSCYATLGLYRSGIAAASTTRLAEQAINRTDPQLLPCSSRGSVKTPN